MKWRDCAVEDLKKYKGLSEAIENLDERIEVLDMSLTGLKSQRYDVEASGGDYSTEDAVLDKIVERDRLKALLEVNKRLHGIITRGINALGDIDRRVLEKFYIDRSSNYLSQLMHELNLEQAQVYRLKDSALYKFTISMYGIEEY